MARERKVGLGFHHIPIYLGSWKDKGRECVWYDFVMKEVRVLSYSHLLLLGFGDNEVDFEKNKIIMSRQIYFLFFI
jgi:hypothetical protein